MNAIKSAQIVQHFDVFAFYNCVNIYWQCNCPSFSDPKLYCAPGMARTQEEMVELEASKQDRDHAALNGTEPSTAANTTSMSRDMTLLPIETSPRKERAEKVLFTIVNLRGCTVRSMRHKLSQGKPRCQPFHLHNLASLGLVSAGTMFHNSL